MALLVLQHAPELVCPCQLRLQCCDVQLPAGTEFCLDFFVERKNASDLVSSIADRRYDRQKALMLRSGLRTPMYVVEGSLDGIQSDSMRKAAKTACCQTEVWAGVRFSSFQATPALPTNLELMYIHLCSRISSLLMCVSTLLCANDAHLRMHSEHRCS